ncbi:hypothetical protein D6825_03845 [Candidatus Woesearchaeota archaeon]|nr:MAG: hypothetical protein D6825_03845 [Candidatus Woesearchaeota archaeon]
MLLVACEEQLPPSPPPPGQVAGVGGAIAGLAGAMPSWAVGPKNVAVTPLEAYYNDGLVVSVANYDYIYSSGYVFNSKSRVWERFDLQGERVKDWISGEAVGSIALDSDRFKEGDNYLVVYACSKSGSRWDCNQNKWMLVKFKVLGSVTGEIPELANVDKFVITNPIRPFTVIGSTAEKDNFLDVNVIRYDARYREPNGLTVLVHVFDFLSRADVDKTLKDVLSPYVRNGLQKHMGNNVAVFLADNDHRTAFWTSGTQLVYVDTFDSKAANKEIIEAYLQKYPSDLTRQ